MTSAIPICMCFESMGFQQFQFLSGSKSLKCDSNLMQIHVVGFYLLQIICESMRFHVDPAILQLNAV